jgi:manganese catalase
VTDDAGVKQALGFLMTREVAHQKAFEKAFYAIEPNFPPGKLPGMPEYTDKYYNMSQGPGDGRGPWNEGKDWEFVGDPEQQAPVDGGEGDALVTSSSQEADPAKKAASRTESRTDKNPTTGADLGAGPGAGSTKQVKGK